MNATLPTGRKASEPRDGFLIVGGFPDDSVAHLRSRCWQTATPVTGIRVAHTPADKLAPIRRSFPGTEI